MNSPDKCPVCGSKRYESIRATGGEWVTLICGTYGSIHLHACVDCGSVYIPETVRRRLQAKHDKEKSK